MIVPIKNSLLYVEPMYLRANGKDSIPEMKRVIVSYGDKILLAQGINDALSQMFNYDQGSIDENPNIDNNSKNQIPPSGDSDQIKKAKDLYDDAINSQKNGDWAKYGEDIKELGKIIDSLNK
jgi:hypothetical protein